MAGDFPHPDPFAPAPDPGQELVPAPGGGLMIKDKDPYTQAPTFVTNPGGGPPIMVPAPAPAPANLPPSPGSVPTGTGPIPGIASTQNDPAPRQLPAFGPNFTLPDPTLPSPPAPGAAPDLGAAPVATPAPGRVSTPGGGGHSSRGPAAPAAPTGPSDLQQFDQAQAGQKAALQGTLTAEEKLRQGEAGNESVLSDFEVANNQERQRQINERQKLVDKAKTEADAATNTVKNFKFTNWWDSRSNAQKFAAGLGIILSGVSWEAHHVNSAMEVIKSSIKDDLELQKQKFQSLQYAQTLAHQGYTDADSMAQKANLDFDRASMLKLEGYKRQLASQLAGAKSDVGKARGAELYANLDEQQKAARNKFIESQADIAIKQGQPAVQKEDIRLKRSQEAENYANAERLRSAGGTAAADKQALKDEPLVIRNPYTGDPTAMGSAPAAVRKTNEQLLAQKNNRDLLLSLKEHLIANPGVLSPFSEAGKERQKRFNDSIAAGRKSRDLGVSNANLALEHGSFGNSGVGLGGLTGRTITPGVIDSMIKDTDNKTASLYRTLRPLRGQQKVAVPVPGAGAPAAAGPPPAAAHANGSQLYRHADGKLYPTP